MGEAPSYGIATGNRFAMVDIGDDIEDPAEFYNLIEQSNAAKKAESKKKKEQKRRDLYKKKEHNRTRYVITVLYFDILMWEEETTIEIEVQILDEKLRYKCKII